MQGNNSFSTVRGKIQKLFMSAPDESDFSHFERIFGVIKQWPKTSSILIWCNSIAVANDLEKYLTSKNIAVKTHTTEEKLLSNAKVILLSPAGFSLGFYSKWARDPFVITQIDSDKCIGIAATTVPKADDGDWAERIIAKLQTKDGVKFKLKPYKIPVAGGNFLADLDFILVGDNQFRFDENVDTVINLKDFVGKKAKVIRIGENIDSFPSKFAHLDMYMTLTGCRTKSINQYVVLVARCELLSEAENPILTQQVKNMNEYLEKVVNQLEKEGFKVLRNTLILIENADKINFYLCPTNNCIVEITPKNQMIWLPNVTQGQEATSHYARLMEVQTEIEALWTELGFKVHLLRGDYHDLFLEEGALHCITNEMVRKSTKKVPIINHL
jgi:hypothetical protein